MFLAFEPQIHKRAWGQTPVGNAEPERERTTFAAAFCFAMSKYSRSLERDLNRARDR